MNIASRFESALSSKLFYYITACQNMKTQKARFSRYIFQKKHVRIKKNQEGTIMDMDELGFFIFMDEMENEDAEDDDDGTVTQG